MARSIITHRFSIKKPEGKRPYGKPRGRWEDNMRVNLTEIRLDAVNRHAWLTDSTSGQILSIW